MSEMNLFLATTQKFPFFDLTNGDSMTLSIGQDCLDSQSGNPDHALRTFKDHSTEIVLTHLHTMLSAQIGTNHDALNEVVRLIEANDQNY